MFSLILLQIFNGCPLKINCTASWIHPDTHDQHILVGAEEGIYTLNLTELHENAMDLLYPRRTVWMFVIKDVLMTLSGMIFPNSRLNDSPQKTRESGDWISNSSRTPFWPSHYMVEMNKTVFMMSQRWFDFETGKSNFRNDFQTSKT